jgi:hypothetical protein
MKTGGKEKQDAIFVQQRADKHVLHAAVYLKQDKIT